jgi:serine/threonine-protein kinase
MFKYGVPVSTFDIASLVQGAMKERQRKAPLAPSIIDKLIEEALLEFTSLTDDKAAPSAGQPIDVPVLKPHKPSTTPGGYVDVGGWIDELSSSGPRPDNNALRAALPSGLTEGNLAALEDDEPSAPASPAGAAALARPSTPVSLPPSPASSSPRAPAPPMPASMPSVADRRPSPATKVGVLVALVVVMAAGAAAWFTHLIPHNP